MEKQYKIPELDLQKIPNGIQKILGDWQKQQNDYQILSYLAAKLFNIMRLPTYYDRQICSISEKVIDKYFDDLDNLVNELDILYKYTQHRLNEAGYQKQDRIKLYRAICRSEDLKRNNLNKCYVSNSKLDDGIEPEVLAAYLMYLKENSAPKIDLEIDILSSWSQYATSHVYGCIQLEREVDVRDILFFNSSADFEGPLESNEWIVINRSNTGLIEFDSDDIIFRENFERNGVPEILRKLVAKECIASTENYYRKRRGKQYLNPFTLSQIEVPAYKWYERIFNKITS